MGTSLFLCLLGFAITFVSRTVFVRLLGNEYLSIAGLLTNVVTILSFTELGLGSASLYCLYKPIADENLSKIRGVLQYLGKLYRYITLATLGLGLLLIPVLPYLVHMEQLSFSKGYFTLVYLLFVLDTVVSYVFIHKKLLLIADQRSYIANTILQIVHITQIVIQIAVLVYTQNYILFLVIQIIATLTTNIVTSVYVNRRYADLFNTKLQVITNNEKKSIKQDIKSIFVYKVGSVFLNGTDNLIISAFANTLLVGLCSNYLLVINSINKVLMDCFNGISASIGNHVSTADPRQQIVAFYQLDSLCSFLFSIATICLACLLNPLIDVWLGQEYLLDTSVLLAIVAMFYITGVNQIPSLYRTSLGLFRSAKYFPLMAAIVNIILSITLVKTIGLIGVFLATCIVKLIFYTAVDSFLIYSKQFG